MPIVQPRLPPLFAGHQLPEGADLAAFSGAEAANGRIGAGDLVWSADPLTARTALVLEPEVDLQRACQMAALGQVAIAETLGHLCPPQVATELAWPGDIVVNGARCGAVKLLAPSADPDQVPAWLVLLSEISLVHRTSNDEPGARPNETSLQEEGGGDIRAIDVIEALAPRQLAWLHTWGTSGFRPIHDQWLFRAAGRTRDGVLDGMRGRIIGLDEAANALVRTADGKVRAAPFLPHVERWPC